MFMGGDRELVMGFPACAGIAPGEYLGNLSFDWFPRMRGDRPTAASGWAGVVTVSPHARG